MNKMNKQKNQVLLFAILLIIIGVANYFNYYSPPKSSETVKTFSELDETEQENLISSAKTNQKVGINDNNVDFSSSSNVNSPKSSDDNYLNYAIDTNGKLVKWNKSKIVVCVSKSDYQYTIYKALSLYNSVFEGYFKFVISEDSHKADIFIDVVDSFDSNHGQDTLYMAGLTNNTFSGEDKEMSKSFVQLLTVRPNSAKKVTQKEMYRVALHEIGHALGIIGHSPNSDDIMYPTSGVNSFSDRDINTIKMMYSGDNSLISSVTANYADARVQEAEKYARMSPNKAISWINLAKVYYDQNRKEDAVEMYKKAISLEPKNPTVYQSMAECYYLSKKYETAIYRYKQALSLSKTAHEKNPIIVMIGMCYAKLDNYAEAYNYFNEAYNFNHGNVDLLKNLLVACVELDYKNEALTAIDNYKSATRKDTIEDEFVKDTIKWANSK